MWYDVWKVFFKILDDVYVISFVYKVKMIFCFCFINIFVKIKNGYEFESLFFGYFVIRFFLFVIFKRRFVNLFWLYFVVYWCIKIECVENIYIVLE